ncbi:MAG: hypothetical protein ABWK01_06240 [Infirmifilum sp.]
MYVTARTAEALASGRLDPERVVRLLRTLGVEKVCIENHRDGLFVPADHPRKVASTPSSAGFKVAGGSRIGTWGERRGKVR